MWMLTSIFVALREERAAMPRRGLAGKYSSYLCSIIQKISIFAT